MQGDDTSDFDAAIRRAGLTIAPDRYAAMHAAYQHLQQMLRVLDEKLSYADESAVVVRLADGSAR